MRKRIIKICRSQIDTRGADYWGFFDSDVWRLCKSRTFTSTIGLFLWMNRLILIGLRQNASRNTVWKCFSGIPNFKLTNFNVATSTPFFTKGFQILVAISTRPESTNMKKFFARHNFELFTTRCLSNYLPLLPVILCMVPGGSINWREVPGLLDWIADQLMKL